MSRLIKYSRLLGIIISIGVAIIIFKGLTTSQEEKYDRYLMSVKEKEYNGVVLKKFKDKSNHNRSVLVFTNLKEITINSKAYDDLELTDSIVKLADELFLTVFRDNDRFIINLD